VNRGIGGQITGEMLGRMQADVIDLKPQAVLVLAGTNDIARGVPVQTIKNNLAMIADLAEFHKIRPLFSSILPVSDYHKDVNARFEMTKTRPPAVILELNRWLRQFCSQRGFTYVDYFSNTVDQAGFLKSGLADDGLHPNSAGYRAMAPMAQTAIDAVIGSKPAPARKKRLGVF
jgi:acyl-CoA thioesterase-1